MSAPSSIEPSEPWLDPGARAPILYADRDPEARIVVRRFLERVARVRHVDTVIEARAALAEEPPFLFVLDPDLADGDATELVRSVVATHPWMQVFVVCASHAAHKTALYIAAGATDVAVKPFDVGTLVGRVTRLLRTAATARREAHYRRELESRLAHTERIATLGTLCATVAHEIANPLSLVVANADVLARELAGEQPLSRADRVSLGEANEDIRTAARLIENFLSRVRVFSRRRDDEKTTLSLASAVDTALLFLKPRLAETAVRLHLPSIEAPSVPHYPVRLTQAVMNVVGNAIDAAVTVSGAIGIRYEDRGNAVAIVIEDDGPGLSAEAKAHMFEPFFTTKRAGTGLGLLLVQTVMREHGGSLELTNRDGTRGARARLVLPKG